MSGGLYVSQDSLDRERARNYFLRAAVSILDGGDEGLGAALAYGAAGIMTIAKIDVTGKAREVAERIAKLARGEAR